MSDLLPEMLRQGGFAALAALGWTVAWLLWRQNGELRSRIEDLHGKRLDDATKNLEALVLNREAVDVLSELAERKERRR